MKQETTPAEKKNSETVKTAQNEPATQPAQESVAETSPATQTAAVDLWTPVIDKLQARGETTASADTSLWFLFFSGFVGGLLALLHALQYGP